MRNQLPNSAGVTIHPLAIVDADCEIGEGAHVWQFASVVRGAALGENVTVASCAIVDGAKVGADSIIAHGASVHPGAVLGNGVFVGPGAVLCNDAWPRAHKDGWAIPTRPTIVVDDGASICAGAIILPGVHIGRNAMVGAGVVCGNDVPEGMLMLSNQVCVPIGDERRKVRMRVAGERVRASSYQVKA